jgi:uncharacterized protein (TIGR04255 family)
MGEKLKSQPLVEALCEFQFELTGGNELTLPGLFYAAVRDEFPVQTSIIDEASFQIAASEIGGMRQFIKSQRLQLKRQDDSAMLQIGQNRLIVNQLQPYESWDKFRVMISEAFIKYAELCGEFTLKRVGLRYINHIKPAEVEGFSIDDFLIILPLFPKPLDKSIGGFQQTYEFSYMVPPASLVHRTGVVEKSDGETVLALDIDFVSRETVNLNSKEATLKWLCEWLDQAHNHIEDAFISSLNPNYYESLK